MLWAQKRYKNLFKVAEKYLNTLQTGSPIMVDVAGPLCFQGDYQAKDVELPPPEDGDILAIHDTGAYTMSMYCRCATTSTRYSFD